MCVCVCVCLSVCARAGVDKAGSMASVEKQRRERWGSNEIEKSSNNMGNGAMQQGGAKEDHAACTCQEDAGQFDPGESYERPFTNKGGGGRRSRVQATRGRE